MEYGSSIIVAYGGILFFTGVILVALGIYNKTKEKHEREKHKKVA